MMVAVAGCGSSLDGQAELSVVGEETMVPKLAAGGSVVWAVWVGRLDQAVSAAVVVAQHVVAVVLSAAAVVVETAVVPYVTSGCRM